MDQSETTVESLIELLEAIWVQIDPNQKAEFRLVLKDMDLDFAEQAILVLRDASNLKPSVKLFEATYRGLKAKRPGGAPRHSRAAWFDEQREVLRRAASHPEST